MVTDIVALVVILAIVGLAMFYIVRAKKCGVKCIGCSAGDSCSGGIAACNENCCEGYKTCSCNLTIEINEENLDK